jgi:hypothetical protein
VVPWLILGLVGACFCWAIVLALYARSNQESQHSHVQVKNPRPLVNLVPRVPLGSKAIGIAVAAGYLLLLVFLLHSVSHYNRTTYSRAIHKWNASFMCQSCGAIVEASEKEELPKKTR